MKIFPSSCAVTIGICLLAAGSASVSCADNAELKKRLENVSPCHPRLFLKDEAVPALKAKIKGDPRMNAVSDFVLASAELLADAAPVERKKTGKRLLGVSRRCLQRVTWLAFAYRMTGDEKHLRRAEQEMLAAAAFSDWNPSHFLDVAEMTAALALGYDWLYNDLAPAARKSIRDAIVEKGLHTSLKGGWWVTTTNNWNQVCHGGLTLGALAVLEDEPELALKIIDRAVTHLPRAMAEYAPDGVYPEGPSYWKYGTTYNVILLDALESVLGSSFGLAEQDGFMKTPEFYLHATGPAGLYYNFSDCGTQGGIAPAMHWFAGRLNRPCLLWNEKKKLGDFVNDSPKADGGGDRMLVFQLLWGQPLENIGEPEASCWQGDGRTPVAMMRSGWDKDAAYIALKGGSPGTNHAHMDAGSFVYTVDGTRWAIDLGAQGYHSLESKGIDLWNRSQDSERWTVFRLSTFSHNTLVINGRQQLVKGKAEFTAYSGGKNPAAVVGLTPVYEGQIKSVRRGIRLIGKSALVQDELETGASAAEIRWGMATRASVTVSQDAPGQAVLQAAGQPLSLTVLSPEDAELRVIDMENPPHEYDAKNPDTRMIAFDINIPADSAQTLRVLLNEAIPELPAAPLSAWE
jgi:hypothetical protein